MHPATNSTDPLELCGKPKRESTKQYLLGFLVRWQCCNKKKTHPSAAMAKAVRSEAFLRVDPITLPVLLRRNERLWEFGERWRVSVRHLRKKRSACLEPPWLRMTPDSAI